MSLVILHVKWVISTQSAIPYMHVTIQVYYTYCQVYLVAKIPNYSFSFYAISYHIIVATNSKLFLAFFCFSYFQNTPIITIVFQVAQMWYSTIFYLLFTISTGHISQGLWLIESVLCGISHQICSRKKNYSMPVVVMKELCSK